jgi:hypothetical protein
LELLFSFFSFFSLSSTMPNPYFIRHSSLINSKTVGLVTEFVSAGVIFMQASQLVCLCQNLISDYQGAKDEDNEAREMALAHKFYQTKEWLSSEEHENAVFIDVKQASVAANKSLKLLHVLYPSRDDIVGVRMVDGHFMNIVFSNQELMRQALYNGLSLTEGTTLFPTKTIDATQQHTLITISGIPIMAIDTTKQKLRASLTPLFETTLINMMPIVGHWPPLIVDYFFHQVPAGFYNGTVTVILRGKVSLSRRKIRLDSFNGEYLCKIEGVSQFCRHCQQKDDHMASKCPRMARFE